MELAFWYLSNSGLLDDCVVYQAPSQFLLSICACPSCVCAAPAVPLSYKYIQTSVSYTEHPLLLCAALFCLDSHTVEDSSYRGAAAVWLDGCMLLRCAPCTSVFVCRPCCRGSFSCGRTCKCLWSTGAASSWPSRAGKPSTMKQSTGDLFISNRRYT